MSLRPSEPPGREITPENVYHARRDFIKNAALVLGSATVVGGGLHLLTHRGALSGLTSESAPNAGPFTRPTAPRKTEEAPTTLPTDTAASVTGDTKAADASSIIIKPGQFDTKEAKTSERDITHYNNFYEFGTSKSDPGPNAGTLKPRPWTVAITGEVESEQRLGIDDIIKMNTLEDRVYRMRCVEALVDGDSLAGFQLGEFIKKFKPTSKAKYIAFKTLLDPEQMPGQKRRNNLDWPYVEGLRLDEAMNPLTLLATGIYGKPIPNQNGAPLRLVTPWKYGFKGIKSIVEIQLHHAAATDHVESCRSGRIRFLCERESDVDHPRWSQASERRIGEFGQRETLMFNGYGEQVADLYKDMDLRKNY